MGLPIKAQAVWQEVGAINYMLWFHPEEAVS